MVDFGNSKGHAGPGTTGSTTAAREVSMKYQGRIASVPPPTLELKNARVFIVAVPPSGPLRPRETP